MEDNQLLQTDKPVYNVSMRGKCLRDCFGLKFTFMRAFESSPVHCVKSRLSGKRRRPGYGGTADILNTPKSNQYQRGSRYEVMTD